MYHDTFYVENYEHNFINRVLTSLATLPVYFSSIIIPGDVRKGWTFSHFHKGRGLACYRRGDNSRPPLSFISSGDEERAACR